MLTGPRRIMIMLAASLILHGCMPYPPPIQVTDSFEGSVTKWNLRTAEKANWKFEIWTSSNDYVSSSAITLGMELENRHNLANPPRVEMQTSLRRTSDGVKIREEEPSVALQKRGLIWHADVLDILAPERIIPPGEYLLDIRVVIEGTEFRITDVPIIIQKRELGY